VYKPKNIIDITPKNILKYILLLFNKHCNREYNKIVHLYNCCYGLLTYDNINEILENKVKLNSKLNLYGIEKSYKQNKEIKILLNL
jgi:hypothetical protein